MHPDDQLSQHFRLTPMQLGGLKKLGIATVRDLLYHFPARYDQGGQESSIAGLTAGAQATVYGTIEKLETRRSWKRKIPVGQARIRDGSGTISVMWFHQPYLAKKFSEGAFVKAVGSVSGKDGKIYLANPHVEVADPMELGLFKATPSNSPQGDALRNFFAVYPESRGVTSLWFRHAMEKILKSDILLRLDDPIPEGVRERYHLPELATALLWMHTPEKLTQAQAARKRFSFEEMFAIQVARALERKENDAESSFRIEGSARAETFLSSVDFPPTSAQKRAIADILADFEKGHPMARLLEGDVGSGKTLVAAATAYAVVTSRPPKTPAEQVFGRTFSQGENVLGPPKIELRTSGTLQVAYMAPTEILAQQHFQSFIEYFKELPINIGLITGSGCKKFPSKVSPDGATNISRAQFLKWVENGEIAMVVGTHALIQKSVKFQHLAYAIVDEQHRFGTKQRRALAQKNARANSAGSGFSALRNSPGEPGSDSARTKNPLPDRIRGNALPHFLSMTATPIPRTLALTMYGDLDISVLDELPPGRAKIQTLIVKPNERKMAYEKIRNELEKGRQAYVICPRIEEPDPEKENALQARSAKAEAVRLKKEIFPEFEIGLLHGAMKPAEKDIAMKEFSKGTTNILVATSVVEVGVNVPNATAILIEGPERFGLSQLHQLRGRVMRSSHPPICILAPETKSDISMKRLRALEKSDDGFTLAEADLENRGAGDLMGRAQWGVSDIGMEALKNPKLIQAARDEALSLVSRDPSLSKNPALATRAAKIQGDLHHE